MKAILVNIEFPRIVKQKIVSNTEQAEAFLREQGLFINECSSNSIALAFSKFENNETRYYRFNAGNNSNNPFVILREVTGARSQSDLKIIGNKVKEKVAEKYPDLDLRLSVYMDSSILRVEGGLLWSQYFVDKRWIPSYELRFHFIDTTYEEVMNKIDKWIEETLESIAELKRKIKSGELD